MKIGRHQSMIANEQIRIGSNSYEKVKTIKYLGSYYVKTNFHSLNSTYNFCAVKNLQFKFQEKNLNLNIEFNIYVSKFDRLI